MVEPRTRAWLTSYRRSATLRLVIKENRVPVRDDIATLNLMDGGSREGAPGTG